MKQKGISEKSSRKEILDHVKDVLEANRPYMEVVENKSVSDTEILDWIIRERSTLGLSEFKEPLMLHVGNSCFPISTNTFRQDVRNAVIEEMKKDGS